MNVLISLSLSLSLSVSLSLYDSRVHVSESTLKSLGGTYEVEPGHGDERDEYLKDHNVKTYLIVEKIVSSLICPASAYHEHISTCLVILCS